jgi:hypothetical protein
VPRLHGAADDRELLPRLQAEIGELAQGLVEVVADVRGGDLIGRDVVPQLRTRRRSNGCVRVEGEVLAGELALDQHRIFREEEDPPLKADAIGDLGDGTGQEALGHWRIMK